MKPAEIRELTTDDLNDKPVFAPSCVHARFALQPKRPLKERSEA